MRVVFVHLGREHLGIEYLSAVLKKNGHFVDLVYDPGLFSREDNVFYLPVLEKVFKKRNITYEILRKQPDLIAFSVYSSTYQWACSTAGEIRKYSKTPIVFGGIHPTLVPERVIKNSFVDYVHIGEGESSFLQLVETLARGENLKNVSNLCFKERGSIIKNKIYPFFEDLDALPLPDKELFAPYIRYQDDYMIITARGCPFSCSYCCESYYQTIGYGKHFRRRSVDSVIVELSIMKERYNFKEVMFFDSIFFTDKRWLDDFLFRYKKEIYVPFRCLGHIICFDYEVGRFLKDAGCYCVNFGIQTFNSHIRREILNRKEDNSQIKKVLSFCDELKLRYDIDLMFGLPGSNEEDYRLPFTFLKENKYLNRLKCYNLSYFPKLPILEKAKEKRVLEDRDIENIEEGYNGNFFHSSFCKEGAINRGYKNFQKLYKIYPILPDFIKPFIINWKVDRIMCFIPHCFVVFIQLIIGISRRDYRFSIYINNYYYYFKKAIASLLGRKAKCPR